MNTKTKVKFITIVLILILLISLSSSQTFAHTVYTSVLYEQYDTSSYHLHYTDWAISEGKYGWPLITTHSGTPVFTYEFANDFTSIIDGSGISHDCSYLIADFEAGANLWNNASFFNGVEVINPFSITLFESPTGTPLVTVHAYYDSSTRTYAYVEITLFYHFDIYLNAAKMTSTRPSGNADTSAHELGHVMGLEDLDSYNDENHIAYQFNVLMGYADIGLDFPTLADIQGAAVITGIHTNADHVFNQYGLYHNPDDDSISDAYHRVICSICGGYYLEWHIDFGYVNVGTTHQYACLDCGYVVSESPHSYSDWNDYDNTYHDRECICGDRQIATHTYPSSWSYTSSLHYKDCTACGHTLSYSHNYGSWTITSTSHSRTCSVCGYNQTASHTYGSWLNGQRTCTACGYTQTCSHNYGSWSSDGTSTHSRVCSICGLTQTANHTFGSWVNGQRTCTVCGETQTCSHNYGTWTSTATSHSRTCSICGYTQTASHTFGSWIDNGPDTHSRTCSVCGYTEYESHQDYWNGTRCLRCGRTGIITVYNNIIVPLEESEFETLNS